MIRRNSPLRRSVPGHTTGLLAVLLLAAAAWGKKHDPADERAAFELLDGFQVNLFAAEPMVANPIHMTWDPQGRLWVVCSTTYPQLRPGKKPNDKIIVLEDTDGDGRADKSTVFADGLYVPTGLELGDGGVYVANAPDVLFLKDTDGDLRADVRRVVLSGFGTEDSHHSISAWRWGPGGWLYFQEGTFLHSQVLTPHGVVRMQNGGVFQFRPDRRELRVFADYRASNPWGHVFTRWGQSILIDNPHIYYLTPMTARNGTKRPYQNIFRAETKHCGGDVVSGRHLPKKFRGELWTNAYKTHDVDRYELVSKPSGYKVEAKKPVLRSDAKRFRPVDLKVGPRGAVYVADWYNPIINHVHDFRDPARDHRHGRIWRITREDRDLLKRPDLLPDEDTTLTDVLDHLKAPERWSRYQVKRVLDETEPRRAARALRKWVEGLDRDASGFEHHRLEALWGFQTVGVVAPDLLKKVLQSDDGRARAAAVRVLRYWHENIDSPLSLLREAVRDPHPRVRLEAVLTLSYIPRPVSMKIALRALDKPTDRFIKHALRLAADGLRPQWLPAFRDGELTFDKTAHKDFALASARSSAASVQPLLRLLNKGDVDPKHLRNLLRPVVEEGTPAELERVYSRLVGMSQGGYDAHAGLQPKTLVTLFRGFARAARQRGVRPASGLRQISRYIGKFRGTMQVDPRVQAAAIRLIGAWGLRADGLRNRLKGILRSEEKPVRLRRAAAMALGEIGHDPDIATLRKLASAGSPVELRYLATMGLAQVDLKAAADRAAKAMGVEPEDAEPARLVEAFLDRKGGAAALAKAMKDAEIHSAVADAVRGYLDRTGQPQPKLREALPPAERGQLAKRLRNEDRKKLIEDILEKGRAARGKKLFQRKALACTNCHRVGGSGPSLGPDLAAIGASAPMDYLLDAVLRPAKTVKDQYRGVVVTTKGGRVHTGTLAYSGEKELVLRSAKASGKKVRIPTDRVRSRQSVGSLMPAGLVNALPNRQAFLDLLSYLRELRQEAAGKDKAAE